MGSTRNNGDVELGRCFSHERGFGIVLLTPKILDSRVQLLMLSKTIVEGGRLTNANLEPCPYQILTFMSGSNRTWGITKHEVIIQVPLRSHPGFLGGDYLLSTKMANKR
jgi:hypothetical protein